MLVEDQSTANLYSPAHKLGDTPLSSADQDDDQGIQIVSLKTGLVHIISLSIYFMLRQSSW